MLKAVLFDIDNTLIFFDEEKFFKNYAPRLHRHFEDIVPLDRFVRKIIGSTQAMLANDGRVTNAEYFLNDFVKDLPVSVPELWTRFTEFYVTGFESLRGLAVPHPDVPGLMDQLQSMGLKLVAASNPVWPMLVQQKRLNWAGLEGFHFDFIAHIENTSFCKPRPEFYLEVCRAIGEAPGTCLMVGNDSVNDMSAALAGLFTFKVQDGKLAGRSALGLSRELRNDAGEPVQPDFTGGLVDLLSAVRSLVQETGGKKT